MFYNQLNIKSIKQIKQHNGLYHERNISKQEVIIVAVLHEKQDMYTNI